MLNTLINPPQSPDTSEPSTAEVKAKAEFPSIVNLHQDILLHIFHIDTFVPESEYGIHNPGPSPSSTLNVARYSSQTCRVWRHAILNSPAIWSRIIDMMILNAGSEKWVEEVMKRTGGCPLSVYGRVGYSQRSQTFLENVLVRNWYRVRKLNLAMDKPYSFETDMWKTILQQEAPLLESFVIGGPGRMTVTRGVGRENLPVFSAFAPNLQRLHCKFIGLDSTAVWISRLSSVTLSYPLTLPDVFTILSTTARLESLIVENISLDWGYEHCQGTVIHLPYLRLLHVQTTRAYALAILRDIAAHPECAFSLQIKEQHREYFGQEELEELTRIIGSFAGRFFDFHRPPRLSMMLDNRAFNIYYMAPTDMIYFAHPQFSISFERSTQNTARYSTSISSFTESLLPALASIPLGSVTELDLSNDYDLRDPCTPAGLVKFLKALTAVRTLKITQNTLRILTDFHSPSALAFPLLEIVRFRLTSESTLMTPTFAARFVRFLSWHTAVRSSVLTLDLSKDVDTVSSFDWGFLDAVAGLKVVWMRNSEEVQYVCGSGKKARLNWQWE